MNTAFEDIPLGKFDLSLSGIRITNHSRIRQVEKSMAIHGQLQPVIARICPEGYQLIDGYKRYVKKIIMQRNIVFVAIKQHINII